MPEVDARATRRLAFPGLRRHLLDTAPLRHLAYRRLWASTIVTSVGSQLTAVAVPKQIFDLTHSSGFVGLTGLAALVPLVVFALWGGSIADVVDRRRMLLVTNVGIALTSLALFAVAATKVRSVGILLVLVAVQQAFFGANSPARAASIARLVPLPELPAANALNSTVMGLGQIVGPLAAGALMPVVGVSTLYLLDTVALTATLWAVWRLPALPPNAGAPRRAGVRVVLDGFAYISRHHILLVSFLADIIAMVFGMPRALFPEMAQRTFGDPPQGGPALGLLYAAIPLGALVGGVFSGALTRRRRQGALVTLAVVAWGLAVAAFGWAPALPVALVFLACAGAADMASMVFRGAILQTVATDEMRGRMQGVFTVVVAGGPRLADLVHGTVGAAIGTRATVVGGGLLVVAAMTATVIMLPEFWSYRGPSVDD